MNGRVLVLGVVAILALAIGFDAWWQLDIETRRPDTASLNTKPRDVAPARPAPRDSATPPAPEAPPVRKATPAAPRIAEGPDYDRCLAMVPGDPAGANALADAWEATGGGDGAIHCHAAAQIALGLIDSGAEMLEKLAKTSKSPALARASVYAQATQAWLMAGDAARAYGSATLALTLSPDDVDLMIDRSIAAASMSRYMDAIDDLNLALQRSPNRADALVFRAAAWRHEGKLDKANADIARALEIDPNSPEAMLERGILRQRAGNLSGARTDWERVIELAPDTAAADFAQQNISLLDAGPRVR